MGAVLSTLCLSPVYYRKNAVSSTSLFFAFIDLTKAFNIINRELLWKVLNKFGCQPHLFQILREFHDGMSA